MKSIAPQAAETLEIVAKLSLPKKALGRHLEDLQVQGLVKHIPADKRGEFGYEEGTADLFNARLPQWGARLD